jgi:hypothetical protein
MQSGFFPFANFDRIVTRSPAQNGGIQKIASLDVKAFSV